MTYVVAFKDRKIFLKSRIHFKESYSKQETRQLMGLTSIDIVNKAINGTVYHAFVKEYSLFEAKTLETYLKKQGVGFVKVLTNEEFLKYKSLEKLNLI